MKPSIQELARQFDVPENAIRKQLSRNLASLREDLAQAIRTGKPLRGFSREQIERDITELEGRLA